MFSLKLNVQWVAQTSEQAPLNADTEWTGGPEIIQNAAQRKTEAET